MKGIDVSHYQGVIDWSKVKAAGYEFGMIKATFGWDNDAQIDPKMMANIAGCEAAGLPYGFCYYIITVKGTAASRAFHHLIV